MSESPEIHFNRPQLLSMLVGAKEEYDVWGRGTGKSEGVLAPRSIRNIHAMPRSSGVFVGATYQQILTRTLPAIVAGWERMGYKKDFHYFIGKTPPKKWKWKTPYISPIKTEYYITWYNGSGIHLVSQDRSGSANGLSIDYIMGDEAKLLNKDRLEQELFPTNRGNVAHFGKCPWHHGLVFCTDMPTSATGKWILEKDKQMNKEQIALILATQKDIYDLSVLPVTTKRQKERVAREIIKLQILLDTLRKKDSVYYSEASTLDNIEILGLDYIAQQKRILPELVYRTSILNQRIMQIENGFYGLLDDNKHLYDDFNNSYLDSLDYDFSATMNIDCRMDNDLNKESPIDVTCDYGASINVLTCGQESNTGLLKEFKYLNALFVKHPLRIKDLGHVFCDYYEYHRCKVINYYYDHTAVSTNAGSIFSYSDDFTDAVESRGWVVNRIYIGLAPRHDHKYRFWGLTLKGDDPRLPSVRFNRNNCKYLIISMQQAAVKQGLKGFEKDKSSERNKSVDQAEATHFSDSADTLLWGKYRHCLQDHSEFTDVMSM